MSTISTVSHWLPCPVVFISTAHGNRRDIMTATAMFVSEKEPLLAVSVATGHLTEQLIQQSQAFSVVIASESQKELVWKLGSVRGAEGDKFKLFDIKTLSSGTDKPLIPADSSAWFACKVISQQTINGYTMFIARVIEQQDIGNPPLLWQQQALFTLKPVS